jgi:AbrB family looped-hinge helix DNA binding protein
MALLKVQQKGQITIPARLRNQAGISEGDTVEASARKGKIVLTRKGVIASREFFTNAAGEYTPEQRRRIDARLAKAVEDVKAGSVHGPFDNADEMIVFLKGRLKTKPTPRKLKTTRQ